MQPEFVIKDGHSCLRILVELPDSQFVVLASFASEDELRRSTLFNRLCSSCKNPRVALMDALATMGRDAIDGLSSHRLAVHTHIDDADLAARTLAAFMRPPSFSAASFEDKMVIVRAFTRSRFGLGRLDFEELLSEETRVRLWREIDREVGAALLRRLDACKVAADIDVLLLRTYRTLAVPSDSLKAHVVTFYEERMRREYTDAMACFFNRELSALMKSLPTSLAYDIWSRVVTMQNAENV